MHANAPADFVVAVRTLIALVFLAAAAAKMRHWTVFPGIVANYRLLPPFLVGPVAIVLPPVEAAIGAALPTGLLAPVAEAAAVLLLAAFAAAMAINLLRGRGHIDCGCFQGTLKQELRWALVSRNVLLLALLLFVGAAPQRGIDGWAWFNGLLAGGAAFLVLQSLNAMWAIAPTLRRRRRVQPEGAS
jgi:hypothetical protein